MISAEVFAQIERMGDLPSLPRTLLSIQNVASDDRSSAEDLAVCILEDQALTMRVLKVVNSAMYQRRSGEKVRTVHRAVVVMGFETVRKLALGLSVFDMMSKLSRSPQLSDIARHSLITAGLAQVLAEASGTVPPEEAFVTALVHDIGKVVLIECSAAAMDAANADVADGLPVLEAERRHYGISHDRAGRRLAARWQLPSELQNVIGDHHDIDPWHPPQRLDPRLGVIAYADALSRYVGGDGDPQQASALMHRAGRSLAIPSAQMEALHKRLEAEVKDLADRVGIDVGDLASYAGIVNVDGSASVAPRRMTEAEIADRTRHQLELYQRIGQGLAAGEDPIDLMATILEGAEDILGFERVILLRADRDRQLLVPWAWSGLGAEVLARQLTLPLRRATGAVAMAALEHRTFHVPMAASDAYAGLAGDELIAIARCTGFAVAPVRTPEGTFGVLYGDGGAEGEDVVAEQATELAGLAVQLGLVCGQLSGTPA